MQSRMLLHAGTFSGEGAHQITGGLKQAGGWIGHNHKVSCLVIFEGCHRTKVLMLS